jgi:putative FmdB family regulatory protein
MPVYEYQCAKCSTKFEKLSKSFATDKSASPECPKCGSKKNQRVMSVPSVSSSASESGGASHGGGCACCHGGSNRGKKSCPMGG